MKGAARFLSYLSAFLSVLTLIHARGGWPAMILWPLKLIAGSCAPGLAAAGGLGAILSLARGDSRAVVTGLFGAMLSARHVARIGAPHTGFEGAFGSDWPSRIPPARRERLTRRRYTPLAPDSLPVSWERDVVFGTHLETGHPLLCDIWRPAGRGRDTGLGVIYLHGSGWHYLDKDTGTRPFFRRLAGQGHVIMDVAYTLAPQAQMEPHMRPHMGLMLADVKRSIAWLKANGSEYGVNPERLVLMGGSAGGHLALLAAYTPNHPALQPADVELDTSVRAVVSYYGPPDLKALHHSLQAKYGRLVVDRLQPLKPLFLHLNILSPEDIAKVASPADLLPNVLGGTPDQVPELYRLFSPISHVGPGCPPTLQLQGAHDLTGMTPRVRRLHRTLRAAGVPSVYVEFPETEHGFDFLFFPRWSPAAQAATFDTERFLALMA